MRIRPTLAALAVLLALAFTATPARAGRYEQFTEKAAQGPKMSVVAATYFGGPGLEEFVAVAGMPGGGVVAFGNAWGPQFPATPRPVLLGKGRHQGLDPFGDTHKGRKVLSDRDPDAAGMLVFYAPGLTRVLKVIRFDWGVATISTGCLSGDGKALLLAGRCTDAFRGLAREAGVAKSIPVPEVPEPPTGNRRRRRRGPEYGPYEYGGVQRSGDVYVMRLDPVANRVEWVWILEGHRTPADQLWTDRQGNVYLQVHGVTKISRDGRTLQKLTETGSGGKVGLRAVEPDTGCFWYGGDRNTSTGREPWRQPFLYKYSPDGRKLVTLWEWPSRNLRDGQGNDDGLVSDSAARAAAIAPGGDLLVGGWSDGGNSIFTRQPTDVHRPTGKTAFGMSSWGMKNANSLAYLMRIDPKSHEVTAWNLWLAYVPDTFASARDRGAPNFANIQHIEFLDDTSIAFCGATATGLIQTPNAFYTHPGTGRKYGGPYVAAFNPDMTVLLFSSHLPGCENVRIGRTRGGLAAVSRSSGDDGHTDGITQTPTVRAIQKEKQGPYDAHILLLALPKRP